MPFSCQWNKIDEMLCLAGNPSLDLQSGVERRACQNHWLSLFLFLSLSLTLSLPLSLFPLLSSRPYMHVVAIRGSLTKAERLAPSFALLFKYVRDKSWHTHVNKVCQDNYFFIVTPYLNLKSGGRKEKHPFGVYSNHGTYSNVQ